MLQGSFSHMKRDRLWLEAQKEIKYFSTQTDLLAASLSSLASARQSQIYSLAGSQCSTHHFEHAILTQTNNSTSIINSMRTVLKSIESKLQQFSASTCTDLVIHDAILKLTNRILQNCQNHFESCKEASQKLASEALLSESTAKSLLALVLHRPLLHEIDTVIYPDISSLLKANT